MDSANCGKKFLEKHRVRHNTLNGNIIEQLLKNELKIVIIGKKLFLKHTRRVLVEILQNLKTDLI